MALKTYEENGVYLSKKTLYVGDTIKIKYNGLLVTSGAQSVYLHIGYGESWEKSVLVPMVKDSDSFYAELNLTEGKALGLCFKDSADNWDNNSGQNYIYKLSNRTKKKKDSKPVKVSKSKK